MKNWCKGILLLLCIVCLQITVAAAEQDDLEFEMRLIGTKAKDTNIYKDAVVLQIVPQNRSAISGVLIKQNGSWLQLPPDANGGFQFRFVREGEHEYQVCTQDRDSTTRNIKRVSFTIDSYFSNLLDEIDTLPDLFAATDREIAQNQERIVGIRNRLNALDPKLRKEVPEASSYKITRLNRWLQNVIPSQNFYPTQPPVITIISPDEEIQQIYSGPVEIQLRMDTYWNFGSFLTRTSEQLQWRPVSPDNNGKYAITVSEQGLHHILFLTQDTDKNCSEAVSTEVIIHPQVYKLAAKIQRLQNMYPPDDLTDAYYEEVEVAIMEYHTLSPQVQQLIPESLVTSLMQLYDKALELQNCQNKGISEKGNYIQVYGMISRLDKEPMEWIQIPTTFQAKRIFPATVSYKQSGRKIAAQYEIDLQQNKSTNGNTLEPYPVKVAKGKTVKVEVQIPSDLKGLKNVGVVYVDATTGGFIDLKTTVRSTDNGMVIFFDTPTTGTFLLTADT